MIFKNNLLPKNLQQYEKLYKQNFQLRAPFFATAAATGSFLITNQNERPRTPHRASARSSIQDDIF